MSRQLEAVLRHLHTERKAETLRRGWREMPAWVFCTTRGTMLNKGDVRRGFVRVLKRAELPLHFSPHCLRHTFASLLLQQGESPVYVQRQLGHASIKLTVDTYGKWLPMGNKAAVDRLDDASPGASGSRVVAKLRPAAEAASEVAERSGEPSGTRTRDSLLKRQVLYRLS
jgi:integrase